MNSVFLFLTVHIVITAVIPGVRIMHFSSHHSHFEETKVNGPPLSPTVKKDLNQYLYPNFLTMGLALFFPCARLQ